MRSLSPSDGLGKHEIVTVFDGNVHDARTLHPQRGHPLGQMSTGKMLSSSIFFIESSWAA
jgi:hypothetical protein